ncbi:unnamed protein product [Polarella glacialis]|uniref:Extradiol ring-cleavage dioxygenase class III enzyme subunit B domain-containing protein n=1 Tax=Polarella glacialis TaxID=89957 RepID=A0A813IX53_POLGL|nr:unnamed protein product [Polarella glacialis]
MLMFPEADVPVVALSLYGNQDAAAHIAAGEALQPLRDERVLIVGSGVSFRNFGYFFAQDTKTKEAGKKHSEDFDGWLTATIESASLSAEERKARLTSWEQAPSARECHPRGAAEHLMPLFTVLGASGGLAGRRLQSSQSARFNFRLSNYEFH